MNAAMLGKSLRGQKFNTLRTTVRNGGESRALSAFTFWSQLSAIFISSGHYLKKNIWVEENAGLRENTYKTW